MHSSEPSALPSDLLSQEFIHFPNFVPVFLMALTLSQISMGQIGDETGPHWAERGLKSTVRVTQGA